MRIERFKYNSNWNARRVSYIFYTKIHHNVRKSKGVEWKNPFEFNYLFDYSLNFDFSDDMYCSVLISKWKLAENDLLYSLMWACELDLDHDTKRPIKNKLLPIVIFQFSFYFN